MGVHQWKSVTVIFCTWSSWFFHWFLSIGISDVHCFFTDYYTTPFQVIAGLVCLLQNVGRVFHTKTVCCFLWHKTMPWSCRGAATFWTKELQRCQKGFHGESIRVARCSFSARCTFCFSRVVGLHGIIPSYGKWLGNPWKPCLYTPELQGHLFWGNKALWRDYQPPRDSREYLPWQLPCFDWGGMLSHYPSSHNPWGHYMGPILVLIKVDANVGNFVWVGNRMTPVVTEMKNGSIPPKVERVDYPLWSGRSNNGNG